MSRGDNDATNSMIGINWGSSNFRAYLIARDGTLLDSCNLPCGVASLDHAGMAASIDNVVALWGNGRSIIASGMIGSNIGWQEVPYALAPCGLDALGTQLQTARIGSADVWIVPGIACDRAQDDAPDILRGEEIELFGLARLLSGFEGIVALPGTHTKWVHMLDDCVDAFVTSMAGEIFDRLTAAGLLASIVDGEAMVGAPFLKALDAGVAGSAGLTTALFGARARVIRGQLAKADAASHIRGLLIGSEIADARRLFPQLGKGVVPLVGNPALALLYAAALEHLGIESRIISSQDACVAGFAALAETFR